jgi:hypothetical protein
MGQFAVVVTAVEAHRRQIAHFGARMQRADLLQADNLGPESMRLFDVMDVENDMIYANRGCRVIVVRCFSGTMCRHLTLPFCSPSSSGYWVAIAMVSFIGVPSNTLDLQNSLSRVIAQTALVSG